MYSYILKKIIDQKSVNSLFFINRHKRLILKAYPESNEIFDFLPGGPGQLKPSPNARYDKGVAARLPYSLRSIAP